MKKTILSLLAIVSLSLSASAQIEIYVEGGTTNLAGDVYTFYATGETDHVHEIHVENHTGTNQSWVINRRRVDVPSSWVDFLCWGHETNNFGGTCIDDQTMDLDLYLMPLTSQTIVNTVDGEYGFISSHITPSFSNTGTATYRYYVGDSVNPYLDSVDFSVILTPLTIQEQKPALTVGVHPNPASDQITVTAEGADGATVRIMDVLGNQILKSTISESKTIDVSEFRNGIYFVIVESKGTSINRKVVVRH